LAHLHRRAVSLALVRAWLFVVIAHVPEQWAYLLERRYRRCLLLWLLL
jgi:hypothetical protein